MAKRKNKRTNNKHKHNDHNNVRSFIIAAALIVGVLNLASLFEANPTGFSIFSQVSEAVSQAAQSTSTSVQNAMQSTGSNNLNVTQTPFVTVNNVKYNSTSAAESITIKGIKLKTSGSNAIRLDNGVTTSEVYFPLASSGTSAGQRGAKYIGRIIYQTSSGTYSSLAIEKATTAGRTTISNRNFDITVTLGSTQREVFFDGFIKTGNIVGYVQLDDLYKPNTDQGSFWKFASNFTSGRTNAYYVFYNSSGSQIADLKTDGSLKLPNSIKNWEVTVLSSYLSPGGLQLLGHAANGLASFSPGTPSNNFNLFNCRQFIDRVILFYGSGALNVEGLYNSCSSTSKQLTQFGCNGVFPVKTITTCNTCSADGKNCSTAVNAQGSVAPPASQQAAAAVQGSSAQASAAGTAQTAVGSQTQSAAGSSAAQATSGQQQANTDAQEAGKRTGTDDNCYDSDGLSPNVAGYITIARPGQQPAKVIDNCVNTTTVREMLCRKNTADDANNALFRNIACAGGKTCKVISDSLGVLGSACAS